MSAMGTGLRRCGPPDVRVAESLGSDNRAGSRMSTVRLVRIVDRLPSEFEALRAEARAEGYSMLDTLAREWQASTTRFARAGEALLSVYAGRALAGIGGVTIEP